MNDLSQAADDRGLLLPEAPLAALGGGYCGDPFAWLGPHPDAGNGTTVVRAYVPGVERIDLLGRDGAPLATMRPIQIPGLHAARIAGGTAYRLRLHWPGLEQESEDPYAFGLLLGELDLYLIGEGSHRELGRCLGAQATTVDGIAGVRFAVWAPNARRVSVVGDFNSWDGRRHLMRLRKPAGVWELFVPRLAPGTRYKYEVLGAQGLLPLKADPVALQSETAPGTASVVAAPDRHVWQDQAWMAARAQRQSPQAPLSVYEVHAGSWRRRWDAGRPPPDWDELAEQLIPYVAGLGFTHIELLPVMSHPFGGSWGYQPLGLYAPQAEFGDPDALRRFVDRAHGAGLGVILDWVPAHFPTDVHGLARFDGTALYEHEDPREGFHQDWNTLIYNLGRREVHGFMLSSALHWLERYHIDGLRVDAVASMLYRDYSRQPGEWIPNRYGGRENLENVDFLRHLNDVVHERCPGALMIAEESTAWPGVSRPTRDGGLGFSYKWNMGWMHDTLQYIRRDPVHRHHHHDELTFGLIYAFSENFVLPLSHDEVVHGKGSLLGKMPGDRWQRFANLRAYFGFMWSHPGKKLLFMGGELAQTREWDHDAELDWGALADPLHAGMQRLVADLNRLYVAEPALHVADCESRGFHWLVGDDRANSVYAYVRYGDDAAPPVMAICNFTPVARRGYRLGCPRTGRWREILNTDSRHYGGSDIGNAGELQAGGDPRHGQPFSLALDLPPLAVVWLRHES
ncbi:1,4-alpha-glucan branching protein GlgB [Solimonas variicoloris]|uniref:1,4-alpha-glucan branching protein GlgB n=1 Tax=Solimonas variicoloris TaxID=254408 RepID=UPI000364CA3D|nr:1,4-alpha-glucan branching protein GlgB [Solimonas variicoloris]